MSPQQSGPKRYRYGAEGTVRRHLSADSDSVTVSYRRTDDLVAVLIGYGSTFEARIADADSQLPPGEWKRECVSTPTSIFSDLIGRQVRENNTQGYTETTKAFPRHEGQTVLR